MTGEASGTFQGVWSVGGHGCQVTVCAAVQFRSGGCCSASTPTISNQSPDILLPSPHACSLILTPSVSVNIKITPLVRISLLSVHAEKNFEEFRSEWVLDHLPPLTTVNKRRCFSQDKCDYCSPFRQARSNPQLEVHQWRSFIWPHRQNLPPQGLSAQFSSLNSTQNHQTIFHCLHPCPLPGISTKANLASRPDFLHAGFSLCLRQCPEPGA
ncbi:hypothetical protein NPIL_443401 [Nephila pilipes]|uniref:Uncharacterized protein n=1 Tax=Nephila pilipes TaxID=299642 RepID=A0A8X6TDD5_NEPPI|nr:hypothetical protein NPIL_443401 [Nephila pilipes]